MILALLAAAAVGQPAPQEAPEAPPAPTVVTPLVVTPATPPPPAAATPVMGNDHDWMYRPSDAEILSIWPEGAYRARVSGSATLTCRIDIYGLAEECRVAAERPAGKGFGKAALLLRPTFKLKPAMGPDGPVESTMSIDVKFDASDNDQIDFHLRGNAMGADMDHREMSLNGTAPEMREMTTLDRPIWAAAARFDDVARAYPAKGGGVDGYAVAHCRVETSGALTRCEIRKEDPMDRGFGASAVKLASHFRVRPDLAVARRGGPLWVDVPIRFPAPTGAPGKRLLTSPIWLSGFDPDKAPKLFPPEAAAKGVTSGRGVAQCIVAPDGGLTDCTPLTGDPAGMGFSEAAVKLASVMKMSPWTADGGPVDGAVVRLPIRLNLATAR